jgi:hypothetical protein
MIRRRTALAAVLAALTTGTSLALAGPAQAQVDTPGVTIHCESLGDEFICDGDDTRPGNLIATSWFIDGAWRHEFDYEWSILSACYENGSTDVSFHTVRQSANGGPLMGGSAHMTVRCRCNEPH